MAPGSSLVWGLCLLIAISNHVVEPRGVSGNIRLVAMRNNQYWVSTTSPYAPRLNFFLAYQYCRNLGLQLLTFETQEEIEGLSAYLAQSYSGVRGEVIEYWTSGNTLGTDSSWIWMSTGEQLNSSFVNDNGLTQMHPQRLSANEQCLLMKTINPRRSVFIPESCHRSLPFICEQIRCISYYYPTEEFLGLVSPTFSNEFISGHRSDLSELSSETSEFSVINMSSSSTSTTSAADEQQDVKPNSTTSTSTTTTTTTAATTTQKPKVSKS